ncbi:hypothetical protein NDI76_04550 [Halogeometricum sp. S1BR25-6]|uniref:Uncharacterized protein n=1 Tax=Halogeometricum salsisoli TaxID=2950536 RepID=A0ABU2GB90_9EURY|nr:hypothetical protein [Halogeometricum sp. S1BR25-6]MDS0298004.1 hypothetical protein [Halogeometricum sp. S1BR25-6]
MLNLDRQRRDLRRDGARFLVGVAGLLVAELVVPAASFFTADGAVHGFLFGASLGVLLSGVFRATARQALSSTLALGVGFALGAVVDLF